MPDRWTVPRTVSRVHRDVLAFLGFDRRGNVCTRSDNGLLREIRFYSPRWGVPETKGIQVFLMVKPADMPEPLTPFRRDALWTHLEPIRGLPAYPRPAAADPPAAELMEDVAGPAVDFLCHATDLLSFAAMARETHEQSASWGPFSVFPKGSAPLQAAAFAAALADDSTLSDQIAAAVSAEEADSREVRDFKAELSRVRPDR